MADESKSVGTLTEENDAEDDSGNFEDAVEQQENEQSALKPEIFKDKLTDNLTAETESTPIDGDSREHVETGGDSSDNFNIVVNGNGHENNLANNQANDAKCGANDGQGSDVEDDEIEVVSDEEEEDDDEVYSEEEELEEDEEEAAVFGMGEEVQEEEMARDKEGTVREEEEAAMEEEDEEDEEESIDPNEDGHILDNMYMYESPGGILTVLETEEAHCADYNYIACEGEDSDSGDSEGVITFTTPVHSPEDDLPETVTKLETEDGCKVYLVGTAHFSEKSQEDVARTIQAIQPDIVMVELCKSRVDMLMYDEAFLLKEVENMSFQKLRMCIKQNGVIGGLMHLLLLNLSAHISKQIGMAPGGEFRKAFHEHKRVPGCKFHLGDRPIQVTLNRVMGALSIWQKLYLGLHILTTQETITKEDIEKGKEKDFLAEMLAELVGDYPTLYEVFVSERDKFMAHTLRLAASPLFLHRHEATGIIYYRKLPKVVAVVGIGHVQGIKDNWGKQIDIQELMTVPGPSRAGQFIKVFGKAAAVAVLSWSTYKLLQWTNLASLVGNYLPEKIPFL